MLYKRTGFFDVCPVSMMIMLGNVDWLSSVSEFLTQFSSDFLGLFDHLSRFEGRGRVLLCACVEIICALSLRFVKFALFAIELRKNEFGCNFFMEREKSLSTGRFFWCFKESNFFYSSTPPSDSPGPSRNAECSNCKLLLGKIKILEATMKMYMHPVQHTLNSIALLHEVYNDIGKLGLE
ncbi:hypothetical protein Tco_0571574 [Tanacetum coccineum]